MDLDLRLFCQLLLSQLLLLLLAYRGIFLPEKIIIRTVEMRRISKPKENVTIMFTVCKAEITAVYFLWGFDRFMDCIVFAQLSSLSVFLPGSQLGKYMLLATCWGPDGQISGATIADGCDILSRVLAIGLSPSWKQTDQNRARGECVCSSLGWPHTHTHTHTCVGGRKACAHT